MGTLATGGNVSRHDYLPFNNMKDGILFYFGICILALLLKYVIAKLNTYFRKDKIKHLSHEDIHAHNHEEEHFIAHLIKYFLLLVFAILAYKFLNSAFIQNIS